MIQDLIITEPELTAYGAACAEMVRKGARDIYTRAVAWAWEDWKAQRRADDDGWSPRIWH